MRITDGMQSSSMLRNLQNSNERKMKLQEQIETGRRISRPSDDPAGVSRSLKLQRDLCENKQYTKNVQDAMAFLDATDTALNGESGVIALLHRLQEIAVNGSNGTLPQESRNALAYEVDELLSQLVQIANTTHGGVYVFAGEKVTTQPYALTPPTGPPYTDVSYQGNNGKLNYEIAPGVADNVNYTGPEVFGVEINPLPTLPLTTLPLPDPLPDVDGSIFQHVILLRDALFADDNEEGFASIQVLEQALAKDLDNVLNYQSTIGAKYNKMELALNRLQAAYVNIYQQIADNDDTDLAYATVQLKLEENVYSAALAVGARVIPPSLLDFLR